MENLDLTRHSPDEFAGKRLSIGGCDYVVGVLVRDSLQGRAHVLRNLASGIALHLVQVRNEYRSDPAAARDASRLKVEQTAKTRADLQSGGGGGTPVAIIRVFEAAAGTLEIHEYPRHPDPAGEPVLRRVDEHMSALRFDTASTELRTFLAAHPCHTHALAGLAECQRLAGDPLAALPLISQAIQLEPNFARYRVQQMELNLLAGLPAVALAQFEEFQQRFPGEHDGDVPGIQAHMACGQMEKARALLHQASLSADIRASLAPAVEDGCRAVAEVAPMLRALGGHAIHATTLPDDLLETLAQAHARFSNHPFLNANLGFALRRAGRLQEATAVLVRAAGAMPASWMPHCWINAAFCMVDLKEFRHANAMIGLAMHILGYPDRTLRPLGMPDVLSWIDPTHGATTQKSARGGAEILRDWLTDPAPQVVPAAAVQALAQLYEPGSAPRTGASPPPVAA